jgi:hypothetical protein
MKRLLFIIGLCCWASVANAAWVVSVVIDADKTAAPSVGTATATFTDTDNSEFVFSQRATHSLTLRLRREMRGSQRKLPKTMLKTS